MGFRGGCKAACFSVSFNQSSWSLVYSYVLQGQVGVRTVPLDDGLEQKRQQWLPEIWGYKKSRFLFVPHCFEQLGTISAFASTVPSPALAECEPDAWLAVCEPSRGAAEFEPAPVLFLGSC